MAVDVLTSDGDWGRNLSLRLNGFSQDGKQLFGILSEGGNFPSTTLFDYNTGDGKLRVIDLTKRFANMVAAKCHATFDVIGTTATGAIVLKLNSAKQCAPGGRWLVSPSSSSVRRLPQDASFLGLYQFKDDAP